MLQLHLGECAHSPRWFNDLPVIGKMPPEQARIKITLSRLRVASYPGSGMHRVLLHFFAQNQLPHSKEDLHYNATYRVREGEHAGIHGYPIFIGLNVGDEGLSFRCRTINVSNDQDEAFLDFLESDVFKAGLKLVNTAQPVIAPFSELARFDLPSRHRPGGAAHRSPTIDSLQLPHLQYKPLR